MSPLCGAVQFLVTLLSLGAALAADCSGGSEYGACRKVRETPGADLVCATAASPALNVSAATSQRCIDDCTGEPLLCGHGVNFRQLDNLCQMYGIPPISFQTIPGCTYYQKIETNRPARPRDCSDQYAVGHLSDGVYSIYVGSELRPLQVCCDMTTDNQQWLVFQRRQDGSEDFYRTWAEYAAGFRNLSGEFWLGNENIHELTSDGRRYELRVDVEDFLDNVAYALYEDFRLGSAATDYTLESVGTYSGTAAAFTCEGDGLAYHVGKKFTTKDVDNDWAGFNCAAADKNRGAWWFGYCLESHLNGWWFGYCLQCHLNGFYFPGGSNNDTGNGINWFYFAGHHHSLKFTEMKIRPAADP